MLLNTMVSITLVEVATDEYHQSLIPGTRGLLCEGRHYSMGQFASHVEQHATL